ncbi:MAG: NYN domain-containing protein [Nitrososphaerales archaeon]|jgi:hypothetical protein
MENLQAEATTVTQNNPHKIRVIALIDGFNLYHSLERFDGGKDEADRARYQRYKWLCLTALVKRFVAPMTEELVSVEYFTTLPTWDDAKKLRHQTYISAQKLRGVNVTLGEFKRKIVPCRASCKQEFAINVEKQTDVNIALAMNGLSGQYDKLLLLTADSDQVPTINLLKKMHPTKRVAVIIPVGRKAKELKQACGGSAFKITEEHLSQCQLPNPMPIMKDGRQVALLVKPTVWPIL